MRHYKEDREMTWFWILVAFVWGMVIGACIRDAMTGWPSRALRAERWRLDEAWREVEMERFDQEHPEVVKWLRGEE